MARKIKIEEYLKDKNKKSWKSDRIKLFSLILNGVLLVCVIVLVALYILLRSNSISKKEHDLIVTGKNNTISNLEANLTTLDYILDGKDYFYVKEKLDFFDKNIVFKIKGYGNYYYTYDCVEKKTNGKAYTYWAYNIEAAKSSGLKKGGC